MNIAHHSLMAYAVIVLACSSVQAQTYRSEEVIDKAARYLQEVVGDELIRYFIYDTYSYYSYAQRRGHVEYETLIAADSTLRSEERRVGRECRTRVGAFGRTYRADR